MILITVKTIRDTKVLVKFYNSAVVHNLIASEI